MDPISVGNSALPLKYAFNCEQDAKENKQHFWSSTAMEWYKNTRSNGSKLKFILPDT